MTTIRKTVSWMILLAIGGAVGGGAYLWQEFHDYDRIIRDQIEIALQEKVPDWDVAFDNAQLDLSAAAVRLTNVRLRPRGRDGELVHVVEIVAALDRQLLTESRLFRVQRLALVEPTVWVQRDEAGSWNWQHLAPPPRSDAPCPDVDIIRGTVVVRSDRTAQLPETEFSCRNVNGRLVPSGHRRYAVRIETNVDHAGTLAVSGMIDLPSRAWQLHGDIAALDTQRGVLGVASGLSPELRERMQEFSEPERIAEWGPSTAPMNGARPASASGRRTPVRTAQAQVPQSQFSLPELGVRAQLDLHFDLGQANSGAPFEYAVEATIHQGEIDNPALPVPLYDLRGRIRASHQEIVLEDVTAANGQSLLFVSGRLGRLAAGWSKDFTVRAENLELNRSIRDYMHNDRLLRMYDQLQPAGRFNLDVHVAHDGAAPWQITLNEFTALDCSLLHEAFQYPIQRIAGTIKQEGYDFIVDLEGLAGNRPVQLDGQMRSPGPELEATFHVTSTDVPLDDRVLKALALPKYDRVRVALKALRLEGLANVNATLSRPGGANQKFALQLHVDVRDGVINYTQFPYRITGLSGSIHFDPFDPAYGRAWYFQNLQGVHEDSLGRFGATVLTGEASFDLRESPGRLQLAVRAENAPIDADLHRACLTASADLARIWEELSPAGRMAHANVELDWAPGHRPIVTLPSVYLTGGRLKLRALPLEWNDVNARFSWRDGVATIHSTLSATHGGMSVNIIGSEDEPAAIIEIEPRPNVAWHAHFDEIRISNIAVDDALLRALPPGLAKVLAALHLQGPIDTELGIDLKGAALSPDTVTAQWSQRILLNGNRLTAGVELERAIGIIQIVEGVWDGTAPTVEGYVNLASARALNMPLEAIRGPFTIDGNLLVIGTPDHRQEKWPLAMPVKHSGQNLFPGSQMRVDRFFADEQHRGRLGINAVALIDPNDSERTEYWAEATVSDASLRAWAVDRGIAPGKLRGSVNGQLAFRGQGSSGRKIQGQGYMSLSEAELFDLPMFASMMPMLNFKQSTGTLFNSGFADFRLHDGLVDFNGIDLDGDAFRLVGKGWSEFTSDSQGRVNLHFYSKANDQFLGLVGRVPGFGAFFDNWLHIQATGTMSNPAVRQLPTSPADYMKGFLDEIDDIRHRMMPFAMPAQRMPAQGGRERPNGR